MNSIGTRWVIPWRLAFAISLFAIVFSARAEDAKSHDPTQDLAWKFGPTRVTVSSRASLKVPAEVGALDEAQSDKFMQLTGNVPSPGTTIVSGRSGWFAVFQFTESGYVKDDEEIDAAELRGTIKEGDGPGNEERKRLGLPLLITDGWYLPPRYDKAERRLEWALKLHNPADNVPIINYTIRVLGRHGYERAVLVSSPEQLDSDLVQFKSMLKNFEFNSGERYAEFRAGDHVAEFGLGALVVGGAAAVATKTGFWKVLLAGLAASWKLVAAAVAAGAAGLGKLFRRSPK